MIELLTSAPVLRVVGSLIVVFALVQVFLAASRAWLDLRMARRQHEMRLRQLMDQVQSETLHRDIEQSRAAGGWSGTRKFRVARKESETADVSSLYLVPHDGKPVPLYYPGQYLTLQLRIPGRDKPLVRCYSLSEAPGLGEGYRISVKRLGPSRVSPQSPPGLSSGFLNDGVKIGDILDIKAPAGNFILDPAEHRPLALICGGIGVTPIYSMLRALLESGSRREVRLFYGVRNSAEHCFARELAALDAAHDNFYLMACYDQPLDADALGRTHQHAGRVDIDLLRNSLPSNNYAFFVCGPPPMMAAICAGLRDWGVPESDIRTEAFGPASVKQGDRRVGDERCDYTITFARSGRTVPWNGADNLLELAEEHGILVDSGCRAGGCGTCMTAVREGEIEYLRDPDAMPESGSCLACIARPRSDLVLDA